MGGRGEGGYCYAGPSIFWEERMHAVVEVRKEEDLTGRESVEEGGLVDTVE